MIEHSIIHFELFICVGAARPTLAGTGHFGRGVKNDPCVGRAKTPGLLQSSAAVAKSVRLEEIMKKIASVIAAVAILGGSAGLWAQSSHVIVTPQEAKWGPAPPLLPEGAQIAVVNPYRSGF